MILKVKLLPTTERDRERERVIERTKRECTCVCACVCVSETVQRECLYIDTHNAYIRDVQISIFGMYIIYA